MSFFPNHSAILSKNKNTSPSTPSVMHLSTINALSEDVLPMNHSLPVPVNYLQHKDNALTKVHKEQGILTQWIIC